MNMSLPALILHEGKYSQDDAKDVVIQILNVESSSGCGSSRSQAIGILLLIFFFTVLIAETIMGFVICEVVLIFCDEY